MRTGGFAARIFGVPESREVVVERLRRLVATVLAVHADEPPCGFVDIEVEVERHHGAVHHALGGAVCLDGASRIVGERCGIFLPLAAVDTIIDGGVRRGGGHLDASVGGTLAVDRLAHRHTDTRHLCGILLSRDRHDEEAELGVVSLQLVLFHHVGATAGVAQATGGGIERDDGGGAGLKLVGVSAARVAVGVVVLRTEVDSRSRHLVGRHEDETRALGIAERHPAHLLLGAMLLRQDVGFVLVGHGALVDGRQTRLLAVAVAVPWATSEPRQLLHLGGHLQTEAHLRDDGTRAGRTDEGVDHHHAVGTDDEAELHVEVGAILSRVAAVESHRGSLAVVTLDAFDSRALHGQLAKPHAVPRTTLATVVVGGQAEHIEQHRLADQLHVAQIVAAQRAGVLAEGGLEESVRHRNLGSRLVHRQRLEAHLAEEVVHGFLCLLHGQLLFCHHITGIGPQGVFFLGDDEVDKSLLARIERIGSREVEGDSGAVASRHFSVNRTHSQLSSLLVEQFVTHIVSRAGQEGKLVLHKECALLVLHCLKLQRLVDFLGVVRLGGQAPVGVHQTVDAEIAVVGVVAEVAAVGPVFLSRRALREQALILEVPNELASQTGVTLVEVEHIAHVAHRIAHRVAVLALDVGTVVLRLAHPSDVFVAAVHRRTDIGIVAIALVVGEACLVELLDGVGHILEIVAAARLIAERPDEDADVVAHPLHMILRTLHHRIAEFLHRRQLLVGVALHVGLCQHVKPVLVAKVVEDGVVGIVRRAHGVDVEPLHGLNVFLYFGIRDGTTVHRREVVTVHAVEDHALAVDEQGTIVADAHLAEAHLAAADVDVLPILVLQRQDEVVEVRLFGTPLLGVGHVHIEADLVGGGGGIGFGGSCGCLGDDRTTVHNLGLHLTTFFQEIEILDAHLHVRLGVGVGGIEVGREEVVANLALRGCPKEAVTLDARQSPVVLALQEGAARKAIDLQGHRVLALHEVVGDVELGGQVGVLAVAHTLAVHPEVVAVAHTVETHIHFPTLPVGWHGELAAIGAHGVGHVALVGEPARTVGHHAVGGLVEREGIGHIAVERLVPALVVAQSIDLPAGGNINVRPGGIVVVHCTKSVPHLAGVGRPVELPRTVERLVVGRCRHVVLRHVALARHGDGKGVGRFAVDTRHGRVVPLLACLGKYGSYTQQ